MPTQLDERLAGVPVNGRGKSPSDSAALSLNETQPQSSALAATAQFLRDYWLRISAISAAALIPCFWHRRIEAGDLGSHTYNAWLAQLIERGQAPGLYLAKQWNNILFDTCLTRLGNLVGLRVAEKICVSAAVLIFFWGAFTLISAVAKRAPWAITPCIAMFAYGWTFQQGFLNYYISLGLAFFGVSLIRRGRGLELALALALLPLAWMAHPLGAALMVCLGLYVAIAAKVSALRQAYLFGAAGVLLLAVRIYLASLYPVFWSDEGILHFVFTHTGADQLVLYGERYWLPSGFLIVFVLLCPCLDARAHKIKEEFKSAYLLPLQLYVLAMLAAIVLPSAVTLPSYAAPLTALTVRLTSVTAVLACCLLGAAKPQKWHLPALAAIATVFFLFLYGDTGRLNQIEEQAEHYVRVLPPGQRIVATIWPFPGSRVLINHVIDRACIGQCYSYGNYEPASQQFRVRARPGNPYAPANFDTTDQIESGDYVVQPQDLPLFEIYQCNLNMTDLCMRELTAGDTNGAVGIHPAGTDTESAPRRPALR